MTRLILIALCALAPAFDASARTLQPSDIAGRWRGANASPGRCSYEPCKVTFDIVQCGTGWCGIEVKESGSCGGRTLTLNAGVARSETEMLFEGRLELAPGTEPYVVEVGLIPSRDGDDLLLEVVGATAGEFRFLARDFPFSALLVRSGEAICETEKPVS